MNAKPNPENMLIIPICVDISDDVAAQDTAIADIIKPYKEKVKK